MKPTVALIGPGRLGQAIVARLRQQGYPVGAIVGRDLERTRAAARFIGAEFMATTDIHRCCGADIIFITTGDDQLADTAQQLHQLQLRQPVLLIHCSGLHTAELIQPRKIDRKEEIDTLAMHPLQTFASPEQGVAALAGSYFSLQGNERALATGQQLVSDLGGIPFTIAADSKVLYHAAACMASNFVTTLLGAVATTLERCDSAEKIPLEAVAPLVNSAVNNTLSMGAAQALTGPIVRGDVQTVAQHLEQLAHNDPRIARLYRCLAAQTTALALQSQRLDGQTAAAMEEIINSSTCQHTGDTDRGTLKGGTDD